MLVGRSRERAQIGRMIQAARDGVGAALLVAGEAGIGKTALIEFVRDSAHGFRILEACGDELEAELPFATLSSLLNPLVDVRDRIPAPQRTALGVALRLEAAPALDRFAAYCGTLSVLTTAAPQRPLLMLVDDAQWIDTASAEALAFVARRLSGTPMLLLVATREDPAPNALARAIKDRLQLHGLESVDARALLSSNGFVVGQPVLERLIASTDGNPLALLEAAAQLTTGQRQGRLPLPDPLPSERTASALFGARFDLLGEQTSAALGVLAASGSGSLAEVLPALRALLLPVDALDAAEASGLVRLQGRDLRFCHPLARSLAYYRLSAARRRAAHQALAANTVGRESSARRAWHLAAATLGPDDSVAADLETAAADARARGAPAAAGRALERAAQLTADPDVAARRVLAAAREFHLAGNPDHALTSLERALQLSSDPFLRADAHRLRALVDSLRRPPADVKTDLLAEADRVAQVDELRAAEMRVDAAWLAIFAGRIREALALARAAHAVCAPTAGARALLATHTLAATLILVGEAKEGDALLSRVEPLLRQGDALAAGHIVTSIAHYSAGTPRISHARTVLRELVAQCRASGALSVLPGALTALADLEFRLGDWVRAYAAGAESVAMAEYTGQHGEIAHSLLRLAQVEAAQGRSADSQCHVERARDIALEHGTESMLALAEWVLGFLHLSDGNPADAVAPLERAQRLTRAHGVREPLAAPSSPDLIEAYVHLQQLDAANAVLEHLREDAELTGRPPTKAVCARSAALVAAPNAAEQAFQAALDWHGVAPAFPFERARTLLCRGERLRRDQRRIEARRWLTEAQQRFDQLGARPWAERARSELAATGQRSRPRARPSTFEELTPQELLVALTVAEGATNREAAATLYLSTKTIEAHLSRVYRKLGVRSRAELTRMLLQHQLASDEAAPAPDRDDAPSPVHRRLPDAWPQ